MNRWMLFALSLMGLGMAATPAVAQEIQNDDELRAKVLQAIDQGQKALVKMQNRDGSWPTTLYKSNEIGLTSLVTLSLLNSGMPPEHPTIQKAVAWLKSADHDPTATYDLALCIMALNASGDLGVRGKIARMASKLEASQQASGSWGYGPGQGGSDNSNAQFAVLGLYEAAQAGIPVSQEVWERAQNHFLTTQSGPVNVPGGSGWGYTPGQGSTGSMTVAGIASLVMATSQLQNDDDVLPNGQFQCCSDEVDPAQLAIESGVDWLGSHFRVRTNPGSENWPFYYLYGLERAGRFTGQRFFGDHDWYREGAEYLVSQQDFRRGIWERGSEDQIVGTSLALLFLSKGLSPVVINKLKFGERNPRTGDVVGRSWNQHSRDIANLVEYTTTLDKWPKLLNWQVVDLRVAAEGEGVSALMQSPIQFISGNESLDTIQGKELDLLREYITQGGFIFAVQNCDSQEFDQSFRNLIRRLFDGQYELQKLLPTHDIYRSEALFPPDGDVPELWGVDFGCRTAIVYAPFDHGCRWEKWMKHPSKARKIPVRTQIDKSLKLGVNVIAYATGRELRDKLQSVKPIATHPDRPLNRNAVHIARLRHSGGWDTAPNALRRLQDSLEAIDISISPDSPTIAPSDPTLYDYPITYIHGRKNFQLNDTEIKGLRSYLDNGGFLFADACCGAEQFDRSFRVVIEQMFGAKLERIPVEEELYNLPLGYDIRKVQRRIPSDNPNSSSLAIEASIGEPILEGIKINGKYVVVYSKYDLSCALERQATAACAGYTTEDAIKIGVNIVLYGMLQ
ncbi:DUF4159 domain-containing protein [Planctomicrobium sp. SH668]|uniref:DUF4159 domain-containing protein n=1 Tax=Planctomicrobium sp. SH668 TaxID=3448126 RepID=UPI003F5B2598